MRYNVHDVFKKKKLIIKGNINVNNEFLVMIEIFISSMKRTLNLQGI
jgi:hypothetical protein